MSIATHLVAPEEVMALLDGELSADRAQPVAGHIEECTECRELADALRSQSQSLSGWTVPAFPANAMFESGLAETARRVSSEQRPPSFPAIAQLLRRHWVLTAAASALIAVLAVALSTGPLSTSSHPLRSKTVVMSQRSVAEGEAGKYHQWLAQPPTDQESKAGAPTTLSTPGAAQTSNGLLPGQKLNDSGLVETQSALNGRALPDLIQVVAGPMIARTVSLSIVMKQFDTARASVDAVLVRHHGYAASLSVDTPQNASRSLQASLRIPAPELNAAVVELKAIGNVINESQNGEEVTQQHADLVARLKNAREIEHRLQAILEQRTGKIADVLAVEQEIARVRGEIEQMEAEQKSLEHRVDFGTIELTLGEEYKAKIGSASPSISTRLHNAMIAGYRDAVETVVGLILFFAVYGPSILLWILFLLPIAWLGRRLWLRANAVVSSIGA
jgi:hypothetical protein